MSTREMNFLRLGNEEYEISDKKMRDAIVFPENFGAKGDGVTNDSAAFQSAVDAIQATGGTIILNGTYNLPDGIVIKRHSNFFKPITFVGINDAGIKMGDGSFSGQENDYGNLKFVNVTFTDTTTLFKCDRKLIRVLCDGCNFQNIMNICRATDVCQSMYFINCIMMYCGYVVNGTGSAKGCYDVKISNCRIERCYAVYDMKDNQSYEIVITNNCIEGFKAFNNSFGLDKNDAFVARFGITRTVIVSDNYFEGNPHNVIFTENNTNNGIVSGNNLAGTDDVAMVELPAEVPFPKTLKIINNNIADTTGDSQIYTALNPTKQYTGLTIAGNNKVRENDILRQELGTLQAQQYEDFELGATTTSFPTLEAVAGRIVQYAYQNRYYHSNFMCNWSGTGGATLTGRVDLRASAGRMYISLYTASAILYGSYTVTDFTGTLKRVTLS